MRIARKKRKVSIGDLSQLIMLRGRSITGITDTVDYGEDFQNKPTETWAMVETSSGKIVFDNTNVERIISHVFYIRFDESVTTETWIEYKNKNYNIATIEDFEERGEYMKLPAYERGDSSLPVNFA